MEKNDFAEKILEIKKAELERDKILEEARKKAENIIFEAQQKVKALEAKYAEDAKVSKENILNETKTKASEEEKKLLAKASQDAEKFRSFRLSSKALKRALDFVLE